MSKVLCSLIVSNLKNVTRIVGNNILPPKGTGLVQFKNLQQLKLALRLQENNSIVIKSEIPVDILRELDPVFAEQEPPVETVVEEVKPETAPEPVVEEEVNVLEEEVKPKRSRKKNVQSEG